ncbi:hypothetical protein ACFZDK_55170 [Streptomyces sp. NPDC007901]|uniref:hypothetical protein n=1 Tax=Streptomyces sp. NPDC007901 TaxID=3364785 RepID=UPI0036E1F307
MSATSPLEPSARTPDKERIEGTDFYDEKQFRDFYRWFQQDKQDKVLKADPELHELDAEEVASINRPPNCWASREPRRSASTSSRIPATSRTPSARSRGPPDA